MRFWGIGFGITVLVVFGKVTFGESATDFVPGSCSTSSITDWILGSRDSVCDANDRCESSDAVAAIEGDEVSLEEALHMVHSHSHGYVAVLFYASWCPFSTTFRTSFSVLASLYPSIPHFAIEELAIKPSLLSKYGVHGFPALFLLNSTMRVRYGASRRLIFLIDFYSAVTGIGSDPVHNKTKCPSNHEKRNHTEQKNCPFSWARSPENLLRQQNYLVLATGFVVSRFLLFLFPYLLEFAHIAWRRHMQNVRLQRLWEHLLAYVNQVGHLINSINYPCKRSNFQEGARNARVWASKSLASAVAIGDASTNRGKTIGLNH
ncbi:hypothetical protein Nepgr_023710 [Nepenthes gracilis]|uniref:Thioredoxin domain-containing protein n=1 Tax=Nepenthes gracilis TaxID=150966 RepID=A0AAD3XXY3_NEPGR|nr:hypothetical protein Nepgr_023710 [Nepenthes gracilis]